LSYCNKHFTAFIPFVRNNGKKKYLRFTGSYSSNQSRLEEQIQSGFVYNWLQKIVGVHAKDKKRRNL